MIAFRIILLVALLVTHAAHAQRYSFRYLKSSDNFEFNNDGGRLYCLFRTTDTPTLTVYRKVFLNDLLQPTDSIDYRLDGAANLFTSGGNERYTYHVFKTKVNRILVFDFLITDKRGNVEFTFTKTSMDFAPYFGKEMKLKYLSLDFLSDQHTGDILLIEVQAPYTKFPSRIAALNMQDGSPLWHSDTPSLHYIQTTDSLIIGMSRPAATRQVPYTIYFLDKRTGKRITSTLFNDSPNLRNVAVVVCNETRLMIAGDEYKGYNSKNSHFFMTMYNLDGQQIFDRLDTTDRMLKYRRRLMGSVFNRDGDLVLMGEGYKLDATKAVVTTAAGIALSAMLGVRPMVNTQVDNRIEFITSAVLSPYSGEVKKYRSFPVGPWYEFANFLTDGEHILIGVSNMFLTYNADEPDVPPVRFTTIRSRERLLLTPYGPAIAFREPSKQQIIIELLHPKN